MKRNKGFTLLEVIIVVAILGILAVMGNWVLNTIAESRLVACNADIEAMASIVRQVEESAYPLEATTADVKAMEDGKWKSHYHFVSDEPDPNSGHGNDLDFCDEDNPSGNLNHVDGQCYDIKWIIVCDHDHSGAEAGRVVFIMANNIPEVPIVLNGNPDHEFIRSLTYWSDISSGKTPNFDKWVGKGWNGD